MHSTIEVVGLALFGSVWLSLVVTGCSTSQLQQTDVPSAGEPTPLGRGIGERQLDALLVKVSQLQLASQESLNAAKAVGTPDQELAAARQDYVVAEQLLHDGRAAYTAKQYELGWDRLRAADAAFRRAEEAAVRTGLEQLERELETEYGRLLSPHARSGRGIGGAARIGHGSVNLRDGAGTQFEVVGKVQPGDTLTILAELGEWYRVRTGTGLVGWVSKVVVIRNRSP
jgi:Bacterial SH3 domain